MDAALQQLKLLQAEIAANEDMLHTLMQNHLANIDKLDSRDIEYGDMSTSRPPSPDETEW